MKRPLLLALLGVIPVVGIGSWLYARRRREAQPTAPAEPLVLVCGSTNATRYHRQMCRGLAQCNQNVVKMPLTQADAEMEPCGFCY
ncbi:MAG: hypothetical protein WBA12_06015 [Catalinimonas sp.]